MADSNRSTVKNPRESGGDKRKFTGYMRMQTDSNAGRSQRQTLQMPKIAKKRSPNLS